MPHYSERRTSRLELFFDLVSVAAVAQFIHQLTNGPTRTGMFALAGAYLAVWSIWFSVVLLVNVFGEWTRGIGAMVAGMLGIGVMAASVPRAEHGSGFSFGMAFALTALFVSVCWVRCLRQDPDAALHMRHLRERFGLFVLIALGEATVMLVAIAANERWTPSEIAVGLTGAALIGAIGYLTLTTSGRPARRGSGLVMLAASHLFATAGIVTITSGACIALRDATVTVLPFYARILLATGLVLMGLAGFLRDVRARRSARDTSVALLPSILLAVAVGLASVPPYIATIAAVGALCWRILCIHHRALGRHRIPIVAPRQPEAPTKIWVRVP